MITEKQMKTFVYLPVFLGEKYICSAVFKCGFIQIKVGDVFIVDKRPATYAEQQKMREFKAVSVKYNMFDISCLVELEPVKFNDEVKMNKFLDGKNKI